MRNPRSMSYHELATIVQALQHALYGVDLDEQGEAALYSCHGNGCQLPDVSEILVAADLHPRTASESLAALEGTDILRQQLHEAVDGQLQVFQDVVLPKDVSAALRSRAADGTFLLCGTPIESRGATLAELTGNGPGQQILERIRAHSGRQRVALLPSPETDEDECFPPGSIGIATVLSQSPDIVRVDFEDDGYLLFEADELPTALELREVLEQRP